MHDEALVQKEKGNKHVKNQNWDEAIKCYTKAIECYAYDPIFFANRALCFLKKSKDVQQLERGLNKLEYAEHDLLKVLELEPKNKQSIAALENLRKNLGKVEEKPPEFRPISKFTASRNKSLVTNQPNNTQFIAPTVPDVHIIETKKDIDTSKPVLAWPAEDNIILVKPIKKPPHLRSQKPLKRIDIIETDDNEFKKIEFSVPNEPEAVKKHVFEKQEIKKIIEASPKAISTFKKRQLENDSEKIAYSSAWPRSDEQIDCLKCDDFKVIEKQNPETKPFNISKEVKNTSNINISTNEHKKSIGIETNTDFPIPKTSVQFYLTWKNLKSTEEKYKYLKIIEPQNLPKIFLESLESSIFSNILEILVKHFIENKDCVFNILDYFTQVKRFERSPYS
ncbi:hypothetical protein NQ314_012800 [Rhamnusium bicolor]|uniref:RNA polymerase II-associated protein 3 n=1 Tax=Rhamnusium bicolor TaxID=1586634 RepID=A0AAV8X965_9CUCU|nr:hypothetical protein NQ314_012800 [Rhamnusium bicolor]